MGVSAWFFGFLALEAAALGVFELRDRPGGAYSESPGAFYFFLVASSVLAFDMSRRPSPVRFRTDAVIWLFLFLMLTFQFGSSIECRILLLFGFFFLLASREVFPVNLVFCLTVLALSSTVYALTAAESGGSSADVSASLIVFCSIPGSAAAVLCILAGQQRKTRMLADENDTLRDIMRRFTETQLSYLEFARSAGEKSSTDERNRLSAELHDTIGYTLTNIEMILEAGLDLVDVDNSKLKDLLRTGLSQAREAMVETRGALYAIRRQNQRPRFLNAVQELASVFGKTTGMNVRIDYGAFPASCGEDVESAFYHFIQEGLVNAFSHGKAKNIKLFLGADAENLRISIIDDGVGAQDIVEGIGIRGMRERFGRLGGTISIESPIDGFKITATIPSGG